MKPINKHSLAAYGATACSPRQSLLLRHHYHHVKLLLVCCFCLRNSFISSLFTFNNFYVAGIFPKN